MLDLDIIEEVMKELKLPSANELVKPKIWLEYQKRREEIYRRIKNERTTNIL